METLKSKHHFPSPLRKFRKGNFFKPEKTISSGNPIPKEEDSEEVVQSHGISEGLLCVQDSFRPIRALRL